MDSALLARRALESRAYSYCPYSRFSVGAALLGESGRIYTGCNVESCSFSPTSCAERTALCKAVSEGERAFAALAVAGGAAGGPPQRGVTPCGVCRQMLYEFCGEGMPVLLVAGEDEVEETTLGALLPRGFGPSKLP